MVACLTASFVPLLLLWPGPSYREIWGRPDAVRSLMRLSVAAEADGVHVLPVSGYRDFARQAELFASLPDGTVERPGCSQHQTGTAFDLAWVGASLNPTDPRNLVLYSWLEAHAPAFGFRRPYRGDGAIISELWHWQYVPAARPLED